MDQPFRRLTLAVDSALSGSCGHSIAPGSHRLCDCLRVRRRLGSDRGGMIVVEHVRQINNEDGHPR
jgi:hypothetical protein